MMKKTFWGYDPKKAEEYINSLESQVDILTSKLTAMSMDLNSANEELTYLRDKSKSPKELSDTNESLNKKIHDLTKENSGLIEKYAQLRDEKNKKIATLMEENEKFAVKIRKLEEELTKKQVFEKPQTEYVRNDFIISTSRERAFEEMEKIRKASREDMLNNVDQYIISIEDSNAQLKSVISELRAEYNVITDELAKSVNKVFESLWLMDAYNERIQKGFIPTKDISEKLKSHIDELFEETDFSHMKISKVRTDVFRNTSLSDEKRNEFMMKFNQKPEEETTDVQSQNREVATPTSSNNNIIDTIPEREQIDFKTPDVLKVNTKIKPNDIFGMKS